MHTAESLGIDLRKLPPWKQRPIIVDADDPSSGEVIVAGEVMRTPAAPFQWWVDRDGNIVPLVVSTNRDAAKGMNHQYMLRQIGMHRRAGWLPFYECDDEGGLLHEDGRPVISEGIFGEIATRRAAAKERGKPFEATQMTEVQAMAKAIADSNSAAVEKLVTKFAEMAAKGEDSAKKKGKE